MKPNGKTIAYLLFSSVFFILAACGGGGGSETPTKPTVAVIKHPLPVWATSYLNAKENSALPLNFGNARIPYSDAYAIADFKRDGTQSIFTAEQKYNYTKSTPENSQLSVFSFWTQQPNGSYLKAPEMVDTPVGCLHPRKAAVADINRDGRPDIMVACHGYDAEPFPGEVMYLVLSTPQDGKYKVSPMTTTTGFFHSVALADIDGDGNIDAVATDNLAVRKDYTSLPLRVFMGNGLGDFKEVKAQVPQSLSGQSLFTVEVVDANKDGKYDLIVGGHEWQNTPTSIISGNGFGKFDSITNLPSTSQGIVLDFLIDGSYLYVARTAGENDYYMGASIQKINLDTKFSEVIYSISGADTWFPTLIKFNGMISRATSR